MPLVTLTGYGEEECKEKTLREKTINLGTNKVKINSTELFIRQL